MFDLHIHHRDPRWEALLCRIVILEAKMATFADVQNEVSETLREISEAIVALQNSDSPTSEEFQDVVDKLAAARTALDSAQPNSNPEPQPGDQAEVDRRAAEAQRKAEAQGVTDAQRNAKRNS